MKRILGLTILMLSAYAIAYPQQPAASPDEALTPKDSPAAQTLNQLAKDKLSDQKAFDSKLQQARFELDKTQKDMSTQLQSLQKELNDKLREDKKYKPLLDQIADTQKNLNESQNVAAGTFQKESGSLSSKVNMEANQIEGLIPVVRKENNFPDNSVYDPATQKWTLPAKAPEKK